jgi:hypothetical protein
LKLSGRVEQSLLVKEEAVKAKEYAKLQKKQEQKEKRDRIEREHIERQQKRERDSSMVGSLTKTVGTKAKREAVNTLFKFGRGLLGSLLKSK